MIPLIPQFLTKTLTFFNPSLNISIYFKNMHIGEEVHKLSLCIGLNVEYG